MSPALAGGFLTTEPRGKPCTTTSLSIHQVMDIKVASMSLAIINSAAMNTVSHWFLCAAFSVE